MTTARLTPNEVLALTRMRQWIYDRAALRSAKTTDYRKVGWRERRQCEADARLVRVIDFERALSRLSGDEQTILLSVYRDRNGNRDTARLCGYSERKLSYTLVLARLHLADVLDRLDLL